MVNPLKKRPALLYLDVQRFPWFGLLTTPPGTGMPRLLMQPLS